MKWFFPVLFLLLFSCSENSNSVPKLADGIYLVADPGQAAGITLQSADSSVNTLIADTVPVFRQKNLTRIFRNYTGDSIQYMVALSDTAWMQMVLLQYEKAGKKLALVFDGIVAGTWTIPPDTIHDPPLFIALNHIRLTGLNNFCDSTDQVNKTIYRQAADTIPGKTYYGNGKMYREVKYDGPLRHTVFFYPNGDTASEFVYTAKTDSSCSRSWLPGKRKNTEVVYVNNRIVLQREYYGNGKLKAEWSDYRTAHQNPMLEREYDYQGRMTLERKGKLLKVCGQEDEFNHPQIIRVQAFRSGQPWYSGNLFSSCGYDCEMDSVDTWRFYNEGKPVSERKFQSEEARYRQYCGAGRK